MGWYNCMYIWARIACINEHCGQPNNFEPGCESLGLASIRAFSVSYRWNISQTLNGADVCKLSLIFEPCVLLWVNVPIKSITSWLKTFITELWKVLHWT